MTNTESILEGIKQAIHTGEKQIVSLEASAITGSGTGVGGRVTFDDAFAALRYANPFRLGARIIPVDSSDAMFVAKTGNATIPAGSPWGYSVAGDPGNANTSIWQLPVRTIAVTQPIRSAVLSDVNNLPTELVEDLAMEFAQLEGESMAVNNDQAGSTTANTGATSGLRGLDMYADGASVSAFGTSGTAITNGIHSISTRTVSSGTILYADVVNAASRLPGQYWALPGVAWHVSPAMIETLRTLTDLQGLPIFLEIGDEDGAAIGRMFGWPVIPNPYLSATYPIYLAHWPRFLTIGDHTEMVIKMMEQTAPGYVTMFAEKRVVSSVQSPFAGVRIKVT